jgi:hypothetical protein
VHVRELREGEAVSVTIHHRRFASGFRACELGGGSTPTEEDDTEDTTAVTCKSCISQLRQRGITPAVSDPIKLSELVAARERMRTGDRDAALVVEEDLDTLIDIAQAAVGVVYGDFRNTTSIEALCLAVSKVQP